MPSTYLALLRGVNVGGKNRVSMKELAELFREAGCGEVRTFIQSGNVVFVADDSTFASLDDLLPARIKERFGLDVPVVLRSTQELANIVENNPFLLAGESEGMQYVAFLREIPPPERLASLDPDRSPPDRFAVVGSEIYMHMPSGVGSSKLTNAYFDSKLKTISTGRNWRTVCSLLEIMRR